jgi:hypothetical protein
VGHAVARTAASERLSEHWQAPPAPAAAARGAQCAAALVPQILPAPRRASLARVRVRHPLPHRVPHRAATHRSVQPARHAEASARARHANLKFNVTGRLQAAVSRRPCPRQSALAGIYTSCLSACPVVLVFTTSGPPHAIKLDQGFNKGT